VIARTRCAPATTRRSTCAAAAAFSSAAAGTRDAAGCRAHVSREEANMGTLNVEKVPVEPGTTVEPKEKAAIARPAHGQAWRRPFELVRRMLEWDPFETMAPVRLWPEAFVPDFSVKETRDAFVFKADLPGIEAKKIQVKVLGNRLTITGEREEEKKEEGETFYTFERSFGSFSRSFTLPEGAEMDKIHAELKDGVMTIVVPRHPEAQPRQIDVTVS
jgi:HSP20 family protein